MEGVYVFCVMASPACVSLPILYRETDLVECAMCPIVVVSQAVYKDLSWDGVSILARVFTADC